MRFLREGLNVHYKWSIKKPLGGSNSVVGQMISHPGTTLLGGPVLGATVGAIQSGQQHAQNVANDKQTSANNASDAAQNALNQMAADESAKRTALGQQQQQQINAFADQQQGAVADYRKQLASSLANTAQQTFTQANPGILEDLNSRGLFTSQTARDDAQNRALQQLATQQQNTLSNFDTSEFNNLQDIRGTGLSALLGGQQSALDTALELKKAGIQNQFDVAQQQSQQAFAQMLAQQQQRQQMISSILGLGGQLGAGALSGGFF